MLFMGVLSVRGFPESVKRRLEALYGPISIITEPIPFDFTDYYVPEMGEGIERFFIAFDKRPDVGRHIPAVPARAAQQQVAVDVHAEQVARVVLILRVDKVF